MIRWVYTFSLLLIAPFLLFGLYKKKTNKPLFYGRWKEHFGFTPNLGTTQQPLWIHAVSVGEAIAVTPVIKRIKQRNPEQVIVVTTTTSTGAQQVAKLGNLVEHRYMPLDFPFAIKSFLKAIRPSQMIIVETELWPNTLHFVSKHNIPITVINARLSERSMKRYEKAPALFKLISKNVDRVLCQFESDAKRFIHLGVEPSKVGVTGSIKFDIEIDNSILHAGEKLRHQLGFDRPVWIAASTHAGEDEKVLAAHKKVLSVLPTALLILVPRHPERFIDVSRLSMTLFNTTTRSSQTNVTQYTQVYLGDTMGEMLTLMAASDLCFMGGSLLGSKVGGHNILEPSALGVPSITGPSYFNFHDVTMSLLQHNAVWVCESDEIASSVVNLIRNQETRKLIGKKAQAFVNEQRGAINSTLKAIQM